MRINSKTKNAVVTIVAYLYILLFVYAAVSKLRDYENFQLQVAQSPLLTAYAGFFAMTAIIAELGIALLLAVPRTRSAGLFAGYTLMALFSVYIFIILNYSPYVPCSCGGILEKMGWREHLFFNLGFVALAVVAIYCSISTKERPFFVATRLVPLGLGSIIVMAVLFLISENTLHHNNNFVRRIPPFAIGESAQFDLKYGSYYFAGTNDGHIYLGNRITPSIATVMDSALARQKQFRIKLDDTLDFKSTTLKVMPPYFFVYDGTVPCVYQGNTSDWDARLRMKGLQKFAIMEPTDPSNLIFRAPTVKYGNLLGRLNLDNPKTTYKHGLLKKQIDGFFDTDGMMHYNKALDKFVYLYYYRNEYLVTDGSLNLIHRGNTIDTTTKAKIKVQYLKKSGQTKFAAPPHTVNRKSALWKNLLFVNSMLPGKYEAKRMLNKASIIDVYDINKKSYVLSFYIDNLGEDRMTSFIVNSTHLFAIFTSKIVAYRLDEIIKKEYAEKR